MFTGIIETIGIIEKITPLGDDQTGIRLQVHAPLLLSLIHI